MLSVLNSSPLCVSSQLFDELKSTVKCAASQHVNISPILSLSALEGNGHSNPNDSINHRSRRSFAQDILKSYLQPVG